MNDICSHLIDSLFNNYYIPPVVFVVSRDEDGEEVRICVDGKQVRLCNLTAVLELTFSEETHLHPEIPRWSGMFPCVPSTIRPLILSQIPCVYHHSCHECYS